MFTNNRGFEKYLKSLKGPGVPFPTKAKKTVVDGNSHEHLHYLSHDPVLLFQRLSGRVHGIGAIRPAWTWNRLSCTRQSDVSFLVEMTPRCEDICFFCSWLVLQEEDI